MQVFKSFIDEFIDKLRFNWDEKQLKDLIETCLKD